MVELWTFNPRVLGSIPNMFILFFCLSLSTWRNGRRGGLKIHFEQLSIGSIPVVGSKNKILIFINILFVFSFIMISVSRVFCFIEKKRVLTNFNFFINCSFVNFFSIMKKKKIPITVKNTRKKPRIVFVSNPNFNSKVSVDFLKKREAFFQKFLQGKTSAERLIFQKWRQEMVKPRPFLTWRRENRKKYFVRVRNIKNVLVNRIGFSKKDPRFVLSLRDRRSLFRIFPYLKPIFFSKPQRLTRIFFVYKRRMPRELFKKYMTRLRYYKFRVKQSLNLKPALYQFKILTHFFLSYTNMGTMKVFSVLKKSVNQWFWSSFSRYLNIEFFFQFQLYNFIRNLYVFFTRRYKRVKFFLIKKLIGLGFIRVNHLIVVFSYYQIFLYDLVELSYKKIFLYWRFLRKKKRIVFGKKKIKPYFVLRKTQLFKLLMEKIDTNFDYNRRGFFSTRRRFFVYLLAFFSIVSEFSSVKSNSSRFFRFVKLYQKWNSKRSRGFISFAKYFRFFFSKFSFRPKQLFLKKKFLKGYNISQYALYLRKVFNVLFFLLSKKVRSYPRLLLSFFRRIKRKAVNSFIMFKKRTDYSHFQFVRFMDRFGWIGKYPILLRGLDRFFNRRFVFSFHFKRRNKKIFLFLQRYLKRFLRLPVNRNFPLRRNFIFIWCCFSFKTLSLIPYFFQWNVVRFHSKNIRYKDTTFLSSFDLKRFRRIAARNRNLDFWRREQKAPFFHFLFRHGKRKERKFGKQRFQYSLLEKSFFFSLSRSKLQFLFFQNLYKFL